MNIKFIRLLAVSTNTVVRGKLFIEPLSILHRTTETIANGEKAVLEDRPVYDRLKAVTEFDEANAGVKGLIDSGVLKIPIIFINPPPDNLPKARSSEVHLGVPVINLEDFEGRRRAEIVNKIREASKQWGFFQMVNRGIQVSVMNNLLECVRQFHEQPKELKMEVYSTRFYAQSKLEISLLLKLHIGETQSLATLKVA